MVDSEIKAKVFEGWEQKAKQNADRRNIIIGILLEQLQLLKEKSAVCDDIDELCNVSVAMAAIADILLN